MKLLHVLIGFLAFTSVALAATQQPTLSETASMKLQDLATVGPRILKKRGFKKIAKVAKTVAKAYVQYSTPAGAAYARAQQIQKLRQIQQRVRQIKAARDRIRQFQQMRKQPGGIKGAIKASARSYVKSQVTAHLKARIPQAKIQAQIQSRTVKLRAIHSGFKANTNTLGKRWNISPVSQNLKKQLPTLPKRNRNPQAADEHPQSAQDNDSEHQPSGSPDNESEPAQAQEGDKDEDKSPAQPNEQQSDAIQPAGDDEQSRGQDSPSEQPADSDSEQ